MKKINGKQAAEHYQTVDTKTGEVQQVKSEYTTMSRRPGIGKAWFDKYTSDVFPSDEVIVNGKPARPPRYYDSQYELSDPEDLAAVKLRRVQAGRRHRKNNTWIRLKTRKTIQELRAKQFSREI